MKTLPTIVMDRGIATKNNLELLKEKRYPYIVVERRATEKDYVQEFTTAKDTFDKLEADSEEDSSAVYVIGSPTNNNNYDGRKRPNTSRQVLGDTGIRT